MAKSKKRSPPRTQPKPATESTPASDPERADGRVPRTPARRDVRPFVYAGIDVVLAAVQTYVVLDLSPNRHGWAQALLLLIPISTFLLGIATATRHRFGWLGAVILASLTLVLMIVVLGLLLASAAFLSGVYGAFGKAAASGIIGAAALTLELVALVPILQLKYLLTRAGRRAFGLPPLWGTT
jgi:hypothetical protein